MTTASQIDRLASDAYCRAENRAEYAVEWECWIGTPQGELEAAPCSVTITLRGQTYSARIDSAKIGALTLDRRQLSLMCGDDLPRMEADLATRWPAENRRRDNEYWQGIIEGRRSAVYDDQRAIAAE